MNIRKSRFSGAWYPGSPDELKNMIEKFNKPVQNQKSVIGIMAPHAGYVYSGNVAAYGYNSIEVPDNVVVLCPKHHWIGSNEAIMTSGSWEIPGSLIPINSELANLIKDHCNLHEDINAHIQEHSLEIQLPFLYYRNKNFSLVPIALGSIGIDRIETIGKGIAKAIKAYKAKTLIVGSSDMSHYIPAEEAKKLDGLAIEKIKALDPVGLWDVVNNLDITMCGIVPVVAMLYAAIELGATKAELIKYATSGEVSGDYNSVVGYASLIVY